MRRALSFGALLLGLLVAPSALRAQDAPPSDAPPPRPDPITWRETLDNGLRVVGRQKTRGSSSSVCISYQVGLQDDPDGFTGLAHLTEHLMFVPSERLPDGFHGLLEPAGATYVNAYTKARETQYCATVPTPSLERLLFGEAERLGFRLRDLTQAQVDTQARVVANEALERGAGGVGERRAIFDSLELFDDHPRARAFRSEEDVDDIRIEHVRWFFQRYYTPDNAVLSIVTTKSQAETMELVHRYFDAIVGPTRPEREAPEPLRLEEGTRVDFESRLESTFLRMTWPSAPYRSSEDAALDYVAIHLQRFLEESFNAHTTIRGTSARQGSDYAHSTFTLYVSGRENDDMDLALSIVEGELSRLHREGLSETQFEYARGVAQTWGSQSDRGWASSLATSVLFTDEVWDEDDTRARYDAVTRDDVRRAIASQLALDRRIVFVATHDDYAARRGSVSRSRLR